MAGKNLIDSMRRMDALAEQRGGSRQLTFNDRFK